MPERLKIAAVTTIYFKMSHAQHIVDRFLDGYGWNGTHHRPPMDLVSLYVNQVQKDDESRERLKRHPEVRDSPTIIDALTLGGSKLAVDGVVLVGEHGHYPRNEKGQTKVSPVRVLQADCGCLSGEWKIGADIQRQASFLELGMGERDVDTSRKMGFPFMAGSSLPVTWRIPSVDLPRGAKVQEALAVCYGGVDSYDFHGLETIQCMVERRQGGETGVKWIQAYRGQKFWDALHEACGPKS